MTPSEAMEIARLIRNEVGPLASRISELASDLDKFKEANDLGPLSKRIADLAHDVQALKQTDRKHSDRHHAIDATVDKAKADLTTAMQASMQRIEAMLGAYVKEVREGRTPSADAGKGAEAAAVAGAKAAIDAKEQTQALVPIATATAIDAGEAKVNATAAKNRSMVAVFASALVLLTEVARVVHDLVK